MKAQGEEVVGTRWCSERLMMGLKTHAWIVGCGALAVRNQPHVGGLKP